MDDFFPSPHVPPIYSSAKPQTQGPCCEFIHVVREAAAMQALPDAAPMGPNGVRAEAGPGPMPKAQSPCPRNSNNERSTALSS